MASRTGRRRVDHSSPLVDLDDVFADDALIDALVSSCHGTDQDLLPAGASAATRGAGLVATADPLTELFGNWRQELISTPLPHPPALPRAVDAIRSVRQRKRSHRPTLAIAAAIAALLVGSTFVGSRQAAEGSALWSVTTVLWPDRVESVASRNMVRSAIVAAQSALDDHRPLDAQAALLDASFQLGRVDDVDGRQKLQTELEGLWKRAAPPEALTDLPDASQLAVSGSPSSTSRSKAPTAAQQAALDDTITTQAGTPAVTVPAAAAQVAASVAGSDGGSSASSGTGSGSGGSSNPPVSAAASAKPAAGNSVEAAPDSPATSASPPAIPIDPSTVEPSAEPSTTGSTEQAPAPEPTEPALPVVPPKGSTPLAVQDETAGTAATADSATTTTADSTAVIPTP